MGSMAGGLIPGYVCRLCSNMSRYVILIFGNDGEELGLAHKINCCLPIKIDREDKLPKTVCIDCVQSLDSHYAMLQIMKQRMEKLQDQNLVSSSSLNSAHDSNT